MRAKEFVKESMGGTCAGGIAPVSKPIGEKITRDFGRPKTKYQNALKAVTPIGKHKHAR